MSRDLVNPIVDLLDAAIRHRNVRLDCPQCRRVVILNGAAAWWLFERKRWAMKLSAVAIRFHCSACLRRRGERFRPRVCLVEQEADLDTLPLPDGREWKRALNGRR